MGRSFRKRVEGMGKKIAAGGITAVVESLQKNTNATPCGDVAALPDSPVGPEGKGSGACAEAGASETKLLTYEKKPPLVYGDLAVCRALRIRRRVIASARTKESRGRDWDCVGLHAGMTRDWIDRKALELHVVPDFKFLQPIEPDDHVVSCMLAACVPNPQRAVVEYVATGERKVVWVHDTTHMRMREIFDCYDNNGTVSARGDLNEVQY